MNVGKWMGGGFRSGRPDSAYTLGGAIPFLEGCCGSQAAIFGI